MARLSFAAPAEAQERTSAVGESQAEDTADLGEATARGGAPKVVPPELVTYAEPTYPADAYYNAVPARVRLMITINTDGGVENPEVVQSAGDDYDEAALEAAWRLVFSPALVDGAPRAVRVSFDFVFEPARPREPSVEQQVSDTQTDAVVPGDLSGRLLVADTEAALVGASVRVTAPSGQTLEAVTGEDGGWRLTGLPPGAYQVHVESDGFQASDSRELVVSGEATELIYRLSTESDELEVVVEGERPPREVTRRRITRREVQRIPGTSGDALRSIQSLPGVARPPGIAGLLIVRGSAPGDTSTFVDGANVPLIYHFGGLSSVIPTDMIEELDFYPGNFSVRYGRLRGGVVEVGLRAPETTCYDDEGRVTGKDNCFHGMTQVDLIDGRLMLQGPIAGDWKFAAAGRRSWLDTWVAPVLEAAGSSVTNAPVYYDYQFIVERDRGPSDKLSFRFYGSDDRFETIINDPSANDPGFGGNLNYGTSFTQIQALYRKDLTDKINLDTMLSVGTQSLAFGIGGNLSLRIDTTPVVFRGELGFEIHPTMKLNVGIDYLATSYDVAYRGPQSSGAGESPLATERIAESRSTGVDFRPGWYTDLEWQPTERLRLVPGLRVDTSLSTGAADLSPRLTARYTLFSAQDRGMFDGPQTTVLKAGVGKFSQPPAYQETDPIIGTPGLNSNNSIHYSLGFEQDLTRQIDLSVEGFYKDFYDSVSRPSGSPGYTNNGSGQVLGLETLLKYNADEKFFGWISYTLSQSLRQDCPTCPSTLFQYDQTHNLIILGSYRLGDGWEIGGRFRIVSGPLVTPTLTPPSLPSIISGDAGSYLPLSGATYSERLPLFHQADLRIDKRWTFRTWRLSTYLDVQNVYNNMAVEGYVYNYDFSERAYQTGLPILPSIGVRGEF